MSREQSSEAIPEVAKVLFEKGRVLAGKAYLKEAVTCFEEAQRRGHPLAAKAVAEIRLIEKVTGLARAGERELALAGLEAGRQDPLISALTLANLQRTVDEVPEGKFAAPADAKGWNNMGAILLDAGKLERAASFFKKAVEMDPAFELAWLNLGLICARRKEYENGVTVLSRLLSIKPDSEDGWLMKGLMLENLQKQAEAIQCYDRALEVEPSLEAW